MFHRAPILVPVLRAVLALGLAACGEPGAPRFIDPDLSPADLVLPLPQEEIPELPGGIPVRVVSYNIYGGRFADAATIGSMLSELAPDLVGLQECPAEMVAPIAAAAGLAYSAGEGTALLSRTPLEQVEAVALRTGRGYLHALTEIEGVIFSVYAAHLGWNLDGDRQCQEFAEEHLAIDPVDHLVLVGDFNDEHGSTQIARLESVVADAFTALGWAPGERISWPSTGFDDTEGSQLIDLIFYRKDFAPLVIRGGVENLSPVLSDHKPAWADLLYPRTAPFAQDPFARLRDPRADWPALLPDNLLANPGAEAGLDGWQTADGGEAVAARENQGPHAGTAMFTGYAERPADAPHSSSGEQQVSLTAWAAAIDGGTCRLLAGGRLATGFNAHEEDGFFSNVARPYDDGELVLELTDGAGALLWRKPSGRLDPLTWHLVSLTQVLPPGTRSARLRWISHHKIYNGSSNDALFDDLYLGIDCDNPPSLWQTGNILPTPGAEQVGLSAEAFGDGGWFVRPDLEPFGLAIFPPWSHSGRGYFHGGGALDLEPGSPGTARLTQTVLLPGGALRRDRVAVWGGWLRTWAARTQARMRLELFDDGGDHQWGTVEGETVRAAEWTEVVQRTRLPAGTTTLRLVVESEVAAIGTGAFADDLFLRLEEVP